MIVSNYGISLANFQEKSIRPSPHYARDAVRGWTPLPRENSASPCKPLPPKTGRHRRQGGLRRKAHPEPLPFFGQRKASRAFHHIPARGPGLFLHYQCRDYAPLQSRPSLPHATHSRLPVWRSSGSRACRGRRLSHSVPLHRAYRWQRRTARSAVAAGGSCIMRANRNPLTFGPSPERYPEPPCSRATRRRGGRGDR
jgi:hypothetical protein